MIRTENKFSPKNFLITLGFTTAMFVGLSTCMPQPAPALDFGDLDKAKNQMEFVSWRIEDIADPSGEGFCSAVAIDSKIDSDLSVITTFITAKHCVDNALPYVSTYNMTYDIYTNNSIDKSQEDTVLGTLVHIDPTDDFAFIETKTFETLPVAKIADVSFYTQEKFGLDCWNVGYPWGLSININQGVLNHIEFDLWEYGSFWQKTNLEVAGGSSGSGLFVKDENGDFVLIGTLSWVWTSLVPIEQESYFTTFGNMYLSIKDFKTERAQYNKEIKVNL